mmetsp:Transcript_22372/g.67285  ORF Transcript_22372/g.67285 Transcript_22372/m.67285 type:complete len:225 (+) Transcript_22372:663-1337(+)
MTCSSDNPMLGHDFRKFREVHIAITVGVRVGNDLPHCFAVHREREQFREIVNVDGPIVVDVEAMKSCLDHVVLVHCHVDSEGGDKFGVLNPPCLVLVHRIKLGPQHLFGDVAREHVSFAASKALSKLVVREDAVLILIKHVKLSVQVGELWRVWQHDGGSEQRGSAQEWHLHKVGQLVVCTGAESGGGRSAGNPTHQVELSNPRVQQRSPRADAFGRVHRQQLV